MNPSISPKANVRRCATPANKIHQCLCRFKMGAVKALLTLMEIQIKERGHQQNTESCVCVLQHGGRVCIMCTG